MMTLEEARKYFIDDRYAMVTTGIKIDEVGENMSQCSIDVEDRHMAVGDHVMGGAIYTLADFAFAVASNSGDQITFTTSSSITYLSQPKDKKLIAVCQCIRDGRKTCYFETKITDGLGNMVACVVANGMHIEKK